MLVPFTNTPFTDFSRKKQRKAYNAAIGWALEEAGQEHRLYIDGEWTGAPKTFDSLNPCDTSMVLGTFAKAGVDEAQAALEAATRAFPSWSRVPPRERAGYLLRAAAIMRRRRHEFSAVMTLEVGKTWPEADGDTAEAIDFLEFYAREMIRLGEDQPLTAVPGEWNQLKYIPLGPCAVIPPWNFPLAILVGMTSAAIVAGNTVVLKPSSDSPWIGSMFAKLMEEVRLPKGVLNFIPGGGSTAGEHMVTSPLTRLIAFTGSLPVGLGIQQKAAAPHPDCKWLKRTIMELGGKDAILVDEDTDLEAAANFIVKSAFGFQGQKCSACSRAIIHEAVYDDVRDRVVAKAETLKVGDVRDPLVEMGAVVSESAQRDILNYIEIGRDEGRLLTGGQRGPDTGYFIQPTVFGDVAPEARIHCEEIFGPVLALLRCKDFDDGLRIVNGTQYGLTGAVLTRNARNIEKAREEFHAGNLYVNRPCTGALVGGHPFGGFNMSGTDSKAGGRDYLQLFTQAKVTSERL